MLKKIASSIFKKTDIINKPRFCKGDADRWKAINSVFETIFRLDLDNELVKRAEQCFEHGDYNTVLETLFEYQQILSKQKKETEACVVDIKLGLVDVSNIDRFANAEESFENLINNSDDPMALFEYARYFIDKKNYLKAEMLYTTLFDILQQQSVSNPLLAYTFHNLGYLHIDDNPEQAETEFMEALKIYQNLSESNCTKYRIFIARVLFNLGKLHCNDVDGKCSAEKYSEALEIYQSLHKENPFKYEPHVAATLYCLGKLYSKKSDIEKSEAAYYESFVIYHRLAETNPAIYEVYEAQILSNLGILYQKSRNHKKTEMVFINALKIYRHLSICDPNTYDIYLVWILNALGRFYSEIKKLNKAEVMYKEEVEIRRLLAEKDPEKYTLKTASALNTLADIHWSMGMHKQARFEYTEALTMIEPHCKANSHSQKYEKLYDQIKKNLQPE